MDKDKQKLEAEEELEKNDLDVKPFDDDEEEEEVDLDDVFLPSEVERKFDKKSKIASEKKEAERKERKREAKEERRKARKKYIPLYIVTGLFVIFAAVYFGFKLTEPEDDLADVKVDENTSYDYLAYYDPTSIAKVKIDFDDGYSFTLNVNRYLDANGNVAIDYKVDGKEQFRFDDNKWSNMVTAIYSVTSSTKVVSGPEDLAAYGLDNPKAKATYYVSSSKGITEGVTLLIGDLAPVGTGTYTMVEGGDTIYVCGAADVNYLSSKDYKYRDLVLVDLPDFSNVLKEVRVTKNGETLAARAPSTEEKEQMEYVTTFRISEPIDFPANGVYCRERLLYAFEHIEAVDVIEDFPEDLSVYGLADSDNPITLEFTVEETDDKGNVKRSENKITLGNYTGEENYVYGKISGETSVYVIDMTQFEGILKLTYNDIMDQTIWLHNIKDIDRVEMNLNGDEHVLEVNQDGSDISGTLDGEEIIPGNVKNLVTRILQIYLFDIYDVNETEVGDVKYSINVVKNDGSTALMELREITSRKLAVFIDGEERGYYVTSTDVKNLMDGIAAAKAGDKLDYTM